VAGRDHIGRERYALFIFGYVKGRMTGISPFRGGVQTVVIGGLASAAVFTLAKLIRPS
jgi:VIT1/CCC1 family predicted Fe2+/Mn2+ transporter